MKRVTIPFVILVIILIFIVIYYSSQNIEKNSVIQPSNLKEETNNSQEDSVNLWEIEGKRWDYRIGRTYWGFEPSFGKYLDSCGDNLNLYIIFQDNNTGYVVSFDTIQDKQSIKKWVTFDYTSYLIEQDGRESEALYISSEEEITLFLKFSDKLYVSTNGKLKIRKVIPDIKMDTIRK